MLKDYLIIAINNLHKRFLRTMLTMLGIFIGIAAVVALISLGQGMHAAVNQQFASVGTDKIIIEGASAGFGPPGQNTAGIVDKKTLELVRKVKGVSRAAGRLLRSTTAEYKEETKTIFTASLPEEQEARNLVIEANNMKIAHGRMLKQTDKKKILVGNRLWATQQFPKEITTNTKILVNGMSFEVIGLLEKIGAGRDDSIVMNEEDLRELLNEPEQYSAIFAQVNTKEKPAEVADNVLRTIRRDRHQKEGFEDITVSTSEQLINSINTILGVVQAIFIGISAISLLVGGIGISNTMYTSVLERKREIGIMKAIGARNKDILIMFVLESGLLGMSGGALGILIGIGLSKTVEILTQGFVGNILQAHFPLQLIIGALVFSFIIGIISGAMPARQAAKLPPVEALRAD